MRAADSPPLALFSPVEARTMTAFEMVASFVEFALNSTPEPLQLVSEQPPEIPLESEPANALKKVLRSRVPPKS